MARQGLKFRQSTYQEADFYQLACVGRRAVAPGERISNIMLDTRFVSALYDKSILTPVLCQAWAFYIPWRIVWDGWIDFIADVDGGGSVPVTSVNMPGIMDTGANLSALTRRGYKLTYNQFFGDMNFAASGGWYDDPDDDSVVSMGQLLVWDQFRSKLRRNAYSPATFSAAVVGTDATFVLDDLVSALRSNRANRRQSMTGDKYVDTMRQMGVELDWRIQMAPEFLGSSQQVLHGMEVQSTEGANLIPRATKYDGQHQLNLKRRFAFAEHGVILVLVGFRPLIGRASAPQDAFINGPREFFRPDLGGAPMDDAGPADTYVERFGGYLRGVNVIGSNQNGFVFSDAGGLADIYPSSSQFVPLEGSGPRALSLMSDVSYSGLTPIRKGVA